MYIINKLAFDNDELDRRRVLTVEIVASMAKSMLYLTEVTAIGSACEQPMNVAFCSTPRANMIYIREL